MKGSTLAVIGGFAVLGIAGFLWWKKTKAAAPSPTTSVVASMPSSAPAPAPTSVYDVLKAFAPAATTAVQGYVASYTGSTASTSKL